MAEQLTPAARRRVVRGHEHRMTQRLRVECPQGHRLASMDCAIADALGFSGSPGLRVRGAQGAHVDVTPGQFRFQCPACVRAGVRKATQVRPIRLDWFLRVLAAQYAYGPASVTVRAHPAALRARLDELIPEGDPRRTERREALAALLGAPLTP